MKKNKNLIIGAGAVVLLLLFLRRRKNSNLTTLNGEVEGDEVEKEQRNTGRSGGLGSVFGGGSGSYGGGGGLGSVFGGGSGSYGGGGGVAPSPIVINNPTINTLRPMPIAQSQVSPRPYTSSANTRPYTSSVDSRPPTSSVNSSPIDVRPATSPNTTQAVSQAPMRSNFLMFDGTFYSVSDLDFDGNIID